METILNALLIIAGSIVVFKYFFLPFDISEILKTLKSQADEITHLRRDIKRLSDNIEDLVKELKKK